MNEKRNPVARGLSGLWRGMNFLTKLVANVLVLILVITFLMTVLGDDTPEVPDRAALVLSPQGNLVEQLNGDATQRAVAELLGDAEPQALLKDLLDAVDAARDDDRIQVLVLDLDGLGGASLPHLQRLGDAISDFRAAGKTVIASGDSYSQNAYYLASRADEIHLHNMGMVLLEGYGRYRVYYKDGLDRLGVDWNVFRVGEYKSAMEPFLRHDMSEEAKAANLEWLGDLWRTYLTDVAASRGTSPEELSRGIENVNDRLHDVEGDTAQMALETGMVDFVGSRDSVRDRLIELVGEDEDSHSFHKVHYEDYLAALGDDRPGADGEDADEVVGVIVAEGTILDGSQPPGTIGGDSTASLIRQARHDDKVKAVVLRVNSGGGSAFASEIIRQELKLTREAGKPVVVSMGSVAASGGYWISTASDEIWAGAATITGSIGIFGAFPTYDRPLEKYLGMRVDGVGTTWLAGAVRPDRPLDPRVGDIIQSIINRGYERFLEHVGEARNMSRDEVDAIARGRVWSGEDAHSIGLVDQLGGLDDAIASAAAKAELGEGYGVRYVEKELGFKERLVASLLSRASVWLGGVEASAFGLRGPGAAFLRFLDQQAQDLSRFNDPNGAYAYCFCEVQ